MIKQLISLFGFSIIFYSCSNFSNHSNAKLGLDTTNDMYSVTDEDVGMNLAISQAKSTIGQFENALKSNDTTLSNFSIKKKYNSPDGTGEHMWVNQVTLENGKFKGIIANDAELTNEVKLGDTVIVDKNDITDWMYVEKGILVGGYTIREIRHKMNAKERQQMDDELEYKILD